MRALDRLRKGGFELPEPPPRHQFVPVAVVGDLAFVSGHAPYRDGAFRFKGKVGRKLDLSAAQLAAGLALLGCLRSLHDRFETLDAVKRILKLNAYVMECMTSNCVYEASVGPEPGTTFRGADQVRRGILQMFAHDEGSTARISNLFITGTHAAWEWTYYWSEPAGRNRAVRGCDVFEFSGEKIRRKSGFRKTTRS